VCHRKKSYFFFFFAAFFAVLAFFLVAIFYSPFPLVVETLRHHIIAICSLYRVNQINSQEKNARSTAQLDDANRWTQPYGEKIFTWTPIKFLAVVFAVCPGPA